MANMTSRAPTGGVPWGAVVGITALALLLVGPALLVVYIVADWSFVRGTLRTLQILVIIGLSALAVGLCGVVAVAVAGLWTRWASPRAREAGTVVAVARSKWPELPENARVSLTIGHGREPVAVGGDAAPRIIDAEVEDAPAQLPPPVPPVGRVLTALDRQGHICRSGNSLMVGYDRSGVPVYIELADASLIAIGGAPKAGKSSLALFLLAQAALMDWALYICDPHARHERSIIARGAPMSGRFARQAMARHEIADTIAAFDQLGRARINGDDPSRTPAFLVIDEFPALVLSGELVGQLEILNRIGSEYPKVNLFIVALGYEWNANLFSSPYVAPLRRLSRHRAVGQSDPGSAKFLVGEHLSGQANNLKPGEVLFLAQGVFGVLRVPLIGHEDLLYAAKGAPVQPYTPTPEPTPDPPPQLDDQAPTVTIVSLADRIVELLGQVDTPLTSKEIAGRLEADDRQVLTRLTELVESGRVRRTGSRGAYRYGPPLTLTGTHRGAGSGHSEGV